MRNTQFIVGWGLLAVSLGFAGLGYGQQAVVSSGSESAGSGYVISHGVGEVFIATLEGDGLITQGQQQPEESSIHVSEITYDLDATVFPNPFRDVLTVEATGQGFDEIRLFAVDGALVYEEKTAGALIRSFHPGEIARGMYSLVLLRDGREVFVSRVIRS